MAVLDARRVKFTPPNRTPRRAAILAALDAGRVEKVHQIQPPSADRILKAGEDARRAAILAALDAGRV